MIPNTILVTNAKGGVAKTSLVANIAGLAANSGWRTLAIDTDPQGNLARDLGVLDHADDGTNLHHAILGRQPLTPLRDVRPHLDLANGGPALEALTTDIHTLFTRGHYRSTLALLDTCLHPFTDLYDLIIIDSPPGERALHTLAAHTAHHIIIPTTPDDCSIDGLGTVYHRYHQLRTDGANPRLTILGVALTLTVTNATTIQQRARTTLTDLLHHTPVFNTTIRFAQAAATACRHHGHLAHEHEHHTPTPSARGLANDYQHLTNEILTAYTLHRSHP
jgi:chromosome partitioning protein